MLRFLFNDLLENYTEKNTVTFIQNKCLIYRNKKYDCSICQNNCPQEAITIKNHKVDINEGLCTNCGFCTVLCPAGAFNSSQLNSKAILEKALSVNEVVLGCSKTPPALNKIKIPCVNLLNWRILSSLILARNYQPIEVDISACLKCNKHFLKVFISNVKECYWRLGLNSKNLIKIIPPWKQKTNDSLSRREALKLLAKEVCTTTDTVVSGFVADLDKISSEQDILKNIINNIPKSSVILPYWIVTELCSACNICQGICPNGAWELKVQNKSAQLSFNPWKCTECGLCEFSCPENALKKSFITIGPQENEKHILRTFEVTKCRKCSRYVIQTHATIGNNLCQVCLKRKNYI